MFGLERSTWPDSWRSDLRLDQYQQEGERLRTALVALQQAATDARSALSAALAAQTAADVDAALGTVSSKTADKAAATVLGAREALQRAEAALDAMTARVAAFEAQHTPLLIEAQRKAGAAWAGVHQQAVDAFVTALRAAMAANTALADIEVRILEEFPVNHAISGRGLTAGEAVPGFTRAVLGELLDLTSDRATYPHLAHRWSVAETHLQALTRAGLVR